MIHPRREYFRRRAETFDDPISMADWTTDEAEPKVIHEAYAAYRKTIWKRLEPAPGMRCLDAGCGAGASLVGIPVPGLRKVGFDFCPEIKSPVRFICQSAPSFVHWRQIAKRGQSEWFSPAQQRMARRACELSRMKVALHLPKIRGPQSSVGCRKAR